MLPSFPSIPTDSLHRFLAISGLVVLFAPPLYLKNKTAEIQEEVIHLDAEIKVMELHNTVIQGRRTILYTKLFGRDISKQPLSKQKYSMDSISKIGKGAEISIDSALIENDRIVKLTVEQQIAKIHITEKNEIIKLNTTRVSSYIFDTYFCIFYGIVMCCFGFARWYKKES
jgi:hypothetical protein